MKIKNCYTVVDDNKKLNNKSLGCFVHLLKIKVVFFYWFCIQLSGCGFFISNVAQDFGNDLTQVMLNHNDPETIANAIPPYLLLLETMIIKDPENKSLLLSTATMYSAYIGFLHEQPDRGRVLSKKSFDYALRSACVHNALYCQMNEQSYQSFEKIIQQTENEDLDVLYTLGSTWAQWIQNNSSDWSAIAQLAQVKSIMLRITLLDKSYKRGNAYAYLGVLETILPPALGGDPELGKNYFETALALSEEKNLMIKVIYAKQFARMMFDRVLHDELLNAVVSAELEAPELTLSNALAKKQAQDLLISADEYF